eukprot:104725-Lingulodinium_polyedra.AAC.1
MSRRQQMTASAMVAAPAQRLLAGLARRLRKRSGQPFSKARAPPGSLRHASTHANTSSVAATRP